MVQQLSNSVAILTAGEVMMLAAKFRWQNYESSTSRNGTYGNCKQHLLPQSYVARQPTPTAYEQY